MKTDLIKPAFDYAKTYYQARSPSLPAATAVSDSPPQEIHRRGARVILARPAKATDNSCPRIGVLARAAIPRDPHFDDGPDVSGERRERLPTQPEHEES